MGSLLPVAEEVIKKWSLWRKECFPFFFRRRRLPPASMPFCIRVHPIRRGGRQPQTLFREGHGQYGVRPLVFLIGFPPSVKAIGKSAVLPPASATRSGKGRQAGRAGRAGAADDCRVGRSDAGRRGGGVALCACAAGDRKLAGLQGRLAALAASAWPQLAGSLPKQTELAGG